MQRTTRGMPQLGGAAAHQRGTGVFWQIRGHLQKECPKPKLILEQIKKEDRQGILANRWTL
jgi:hypothetical protein